MAYEEIDRLYEDMLSRVPYNQLKQIERDPAGAMSPAAAISPGRVLKQNNPGQIIDKTLGGMFPMSNSPQEAPPQNTPFPDSQLQPLTTISASPFIDPIEPTFQDPDKRKPEYIENYRGNVNRSIEEGKENLSHTLDRQTDARSAYNDSKAKLLGIIDQLGLAQEPFQSQYDYDAKIKQLQNMQDLEPQQTQAPEENATAEIIRALGAPLLGSMLGEAGAIAQRPAQTELNRQGEKLKKDMADREKSMAEKKIKLSDEISKRMVAIRQLKEGEYESYDKDRKSKLDQLKLMHDAVEKSTDKDQELFKSIAATVAQMDERVYKTTMEGSKEVAKMEETQAGRDAAMERLKLQEEGQTKRSVLGAKAKSNTRLDVTDERQMNRIQDQLPKHPVVISVMKARTSLNQAMSLLDDPNVRKSPQIVADAVQGVIAAVNSSRQSTGGERHEKMLDSGLMGTLQSKLNYITSRKGEIDAGTLKDIKQVLRSMHDSESRVYDQVMEQTLNSIAGVESRPLFKRHPEYKAMMKEYVNGLSGISKETPAAPSNTQKVKLDPAARLKMIKEIEAKRKK